MKNSPPAWLTRDDHNNSSDISPSASLWFAISSIFFPPVDFQMPKNKNLKEVTQKNCDFSFTNNFCVRFFKFPSKKERKKVKKMSEEERKKKIIISAATCVRWQCEAKKCSERFQGFLNMKKRNIVFKYVLQYIFFYCCECESNNRFAPIRSSTTRCLFLILSLFLTLLEKEGTKYLHAPFDVGCYRERSFWRI